MIKWIGQHIFDFIARFRQGEIWIGNSNVNSKIEAESNNGAGKDLTIKAGSLDGTVADNEGGDLYLKSGLSSGSSYGGDVIVYGGNRGSGGSASVNSEMLLATFDSNEALLLGDESGTTTSFQVRPHTRTTERTGQELLLTGGTAFGTNQDGGGVVLTPGSPTGSGDAGSISIKPAAATPANAWTWQGTNGACSVFSNGTGPELTLESGSDNSTRSAQLTFRKSGNGEVDNDYLGQVSFYGEDSGNADTLFANILAQIKEVDAGSEEGKLTLSIASHDAEMQPGLIIESGDAEDEVDATIGNGSASVVTVPGFISIGGHAINDIDVAGEFVDSDEHLMTAAAINDQFGGGGGVTADPFSTTVIKVLPNQWVINDDAGRPLFVEDDTSNTLGVRCFTTTDEMYAWQKLPTGYKATHVQVHASASTSSAVSVRSYNYQTGADNAVSATTGNLNANIDITDIPSSATQDLVIKVSPASGSTIVYGATVTIATI